MTRPTRASINLAALAHNLGQVRQSAPDSRAIAVIKANGYGHGILHAAEGLKAADGFAVACLEEAVELREAGYLQPILMLEGIFEADELEIVQNLNIELVVHHFEQINLLNSSMNRKPIKVWLKLDTGMHRIGFLPENLSKAYVQLSACSSVDKKIVLMTHLANADDRKDNYSDAQITLFKKTIDKLRLARSVCNSAGILSRPEVHYDWVRPGIMLYGSSPFNDSLGPEENLRAVMQLESQLIAIKAYKKNDRIGYGGTYVCPEDMQVGVVAIGYGDGYPRHAKTGTPVLVNNIRTQLIGRVSMDMIMVDLRPITDAHVGSPVQLWGDQVSIDEVARWSDTIAYKLMCKITRRVHTKVIN